MSDSSNLTYEEFEAEVRRAFPEHVVYIHTSDSGYLIAEVTVPTAHKSVVVEYQSRTPWWGVCIGTAYSRGASLHECLAAHSTRLRREAEQINQQCAALESALARSDQKGTSP